MKQLFLLIGNSGMMLLIHLLEEELTRMVGKQTDELWEQMQYVGLMEYMIHVIYDACMEAMKETQGDFWSICADLQLELGDSSDPWTAARETLFVEPKVPFCIDESCSPVVKVIQKSSVISANQLQSLTQSLPVWSSCAQQATGVWTGHVLEGFHGIALILDALQLSFVKCCNDVLNGVLNGDQKDVGLDQYHDF